MPRLAHTPPSISNEEVNRARASLDHLAKLGRWGITEWRSVAALKEAQCRAYSVELERGKDLRLEVQAQRRFCTMLLLILGAEGMALIWQAFR